MSTADLVNEALQNLSERKHICVVVAFVAALDGVDKIIPTSSFENCANLKCVYDYLNDNDFFSYCNNILIFENSAHIDLTIDVGTTINWAEGQVTMGNSDKGVVMTFAPFNCNETDHIKLAETILHESFHARFRYDLANNNMTESQYRESFMNWVNESYGQNFTEHQLMIQFYMNEIASQLAILDGDRYDESYYMAWVWDGLKTYWPDFFSSSLTDSCENKRNIIMSNNPFQCN